MAIDSCQGGPVDAHASWYVAGPLIGAVIVAMLWVTSRPLGALGGYIDLQDWARTGTAGWRSFFLLGIVLGGLAYAVASGGLHPSFAYDVAGVTSPIARGALLASAGLLMGYGARTAGGCTSGHGLCGSALASPASWAATATFMT